MGVGDEIAAENELERRLGMRTKSRPEKQNARPIVVMERASAERSRQRAGASSTQSSAFSASPLNPPPIMPAETNSWYSPLVRNPE